MSRAARTLRITGNIIKLLFGLLIAFICFFMIWRVFSASNDPSSMKLLSPNKALIAAYDEDGALEGMFRQEQRSITSAEHNSGYFSVTRATFIPSANQIQIVVRYNNSTLRHTQEDFELDEPLSRDDEVYDVSLLLVTDLTPENDSDNLNIDGDSVAMARIHPTYFKSEKNTLYNYRLFVFDLGDIDLETLLEDGTLISVFTDIYYSGDVDYSDTPYGTLCLYDYITETVDVKISSAEKKVFEEWKKTN